MSIVSLVIAPSLAKMKWSDNSIQDYKKQTTQTNVIINKQGSTINNTNTIILSVARK
jgi:hypothetical protein